MSPTSYVFFLGPFWESALGRSPYFSRPNRSFIDTLKGSTETKSRAVALSATVAMTTLSAMLILIFMFVVLSLALLASTATRLAINRSVSKRSLLAMEFLGHVLISHSPQFVPFGRRSDLIARRSSIAR